MSDAFALRALVAASTAILTYILHSTVICAAALLAGRYLRRSPRDRGVLWKTALLLPFVTATIATSNWRSPGLAAEFNLPQALRPRLPASWNRVRMEAEIRQDGNEPARSFSVTIDTIATGVAFAVLALVVGGAAVGIGREIRRRRHFQRRLGRRTPLAALNEFRLAPPIRLTSSITLGAPVALGWREVCVPADGFRRLSPRERRSVLTHELAHLARRDPLWFLLADMVLALTPWQPLLRRLVSAMRLDAEFSCDDAVLREMGEGRSLVRSLAAFASRFDPREDTVAASCGGSPLEIRARRIITPRQPEPRWTGTLTIACAAAISLAAALAAPVVSTRTSGTALDGSRPKHPYLIIERDTTMPRGGASSRDLSR